MKQKKKTNYPHDDWYQQGKCSFMAGDYDNALRFFLIDVEDNSERTDSWFHIGCCRSILGQWDKATEAYKTVLQLCPNSGHAHDILGTSYYKQGRLSEAINSFKQSS